MKTLAIVIVLFCFVGNAWGQDSNTKAIPDTSESSVTTEKVTEKNQKEEEKDMLARVRELLNEESGRTEIGRIKMGEFALVFDVDTNITKLNQISSLVNRVEFLNDSLRAVSVLNDDGIKEKKRVTSIPYRLNEKLYTARVVYLDSVKVQINEGLIEFLKIYGHDGSTFYNRYAPIKLLNIEERYNDKLFNPQDGSFILLKNAVSFDTDRRFNYFPNDQAFTLEKDSLNQQTLHADNGLNSFVDLQVYSDLLALLGDEPNEILQFEASSQFYLHRKNLPNNFIYIFYAIEPFFRFNRVDNEFDTLAVADNGTLNRTDLFRRSNFSTGVSLKLVRWDWRPANSLELNTGYRYNSANVVINEPGTANEAETTGIFHTIYGELSLSSKQLNNFGMELSGRIIARKLNLNEQFNMDNNRFYGLTTFSGSIFYFPSESKENKVILRFTNYLNWADRTRDYSALQLGYRTALNLK